MDFQGRYQILEMLSDGEARTFKALQTSSGRIVLLHQLWEERTPPNQPDLASLVFGFLRRATAEEMKSLVDMGEEANRVFVVTEDLPECQDLRQWLQSAPGTLGTAGKASVPKSAPSGDSSAIAATRGLVSHARQEDLASPGPTQLFTTPKVIADQTLSASEEKPASTPTTHPEPAVEPGTFASPAKLAGDLGGLSEGEVLKAAEPPVAPPPPSRKGVRSASSQGPSSARTCRRRRRLGPFPPHLKSRAHPQPGPRKSLPTASFRLASKWFSRAANSSLAFPHRRHVRSLYRLRPPRRVVRKGRRENLHESSMVGTNRRAYHPALNPPPRERACLL